MPGNNGLGTRRGGSFGKYLDPLERRFYGWLYSQLLADRGITLREMGERMGITKQAVHLMLRGKPRGAEQSRGPGFEGSLYRLDDAISGITADRGGVAKVCNIDGDSAREFQDLVTTELARRYATGAVE